MSTRGLAASAVLPDRATLAAFVGVFMIGGGNIVAVRLSNQDLPPFFGAGLRFASAAVLLALFVRIRRVPLPTGQALLGSVIYGFLSFAAAFGLAYWALQEVPAGIGGVILAGVPVITLFLARLHGLERLYWRGLAGALLTVGGVWLLLQSPVGASVPLLSLLAMIAAAVCMAEASVVVKRFPPCHPVATNALGMAIGAVVLLPLSLVVGESWSAPEGAGTWTVLAYLVLFGSVGLFALYLFVLGRWTASGASYQFVLIPFTAALFGAWLLSEPISGGLVVGGVIVLFGVYVGALSRPKAPLEAPPAQEALAQRCATT